MKKLLYPALGLAVSSLVACGGSDGGDDGNGSGGVNRATGITPNAFVNNSNTTISRFELDRTLNEFAEEDLTVDNSLTTSTTLEDEDGMFENCNADEQFNQTIANGVDNGDGYFVYASSTDFSACLEEQLSQLGANVQMQMVFDFYLKIKAVDADGNVVSNPLHSTINDTFLINGGMVNYQFAMNGISNATVSADGFSSSFSSTSRYYEGFTDQSCMHDASNLCDTEFFDSSEFTEDDNATEYEYTHYLIQGLVPHADTSNPYYQTGSVNFTVDNWTGVINLDDQDSGTPSYTATNGSETVNDTLNRIYYSVAGRSALREQVKSESQKLSSKLIKQVNKTIAEIEGQ